MRAHTMQSLANWRYSSVLDMLPSSSHTGGSATGLSVTNAPGDRRAAHDSVREQSASAGCRAPRWQVTPLRTCANRSSHSGTDC
jgi:hypothetical protein